ncbi:hypothetical protein V2J09_007476, partial [Rumex salicifolius]
ELKERDQPRLLLSSSPQLSLFEIATREIGRRIAHSSRSCHRPQHRQIHRHTTTDLSSSFSAFFSEPPRPLSHRHGMANNPQQSASQQFGPPVVGSAGHPPNFGPSVSMQFRPGVPMQPGQQFVPTSSSQYHHPIGQNVHSNFGIPAGQNQTFQYRQQMQQLPSMHSLPGHLPSSQAMPMQYGVPPGRPLSSGGTPSHQSVPPYSNQMPSVGGHGMPMPSTYMFQHASQTQAPSVPAGGQPWLSTTNQTSAALAPAQQPAEQPSLSAGAATVPTGIDMNQQSASDWQEHTSADGRRYYYNKKTRQSSWEKPLELMTPIEVCLAENYFAIRGNMYLLTNQVTMISVSPHERADASTVWKEFTTPEGKKYYYNKLSKESKWTIPEELKLAREQAEREAIQAAPADGGAVSHSSASGTANSTTAALTDVVSPAPNNVSAASSLASSQSTPTPTIPVVNPASTPTIVSVDQSPVNTVPATAGGTSLHASFGSDDAETKSTSDNLVKQPLEVAKSVDGAPVQDVEEQRKGEAVAGCFKVTQIVKDEKDGDDEPLVFANKQEAKSVFKALLEAVNVQSDWNWDQAMRVIINDKRYGALKTLGERKQAFNEYLGQRKKQEAEERRIRQKKAKEEFTKMLEESEELTSSTKWSKAITMFEDDERFKAVERARDREDLFENYMVDLQKKEKVKAQEEYRQNRDEYRKYLESCDFIKVNSQWRKVQDLLEDDDRCARLEKIDRLEIFQDYIRELEKEEEEQKRIQKEKLWRTERKHRDEFRKILEDDIAAGVISAKTRWREYCLKVKDMTSYVAVAHNTSGSTPKELFEDAVEELENQYHDDKSRVKDLTKSGKISVVSTTIFEDFKASILEEFDLPAISDINLKLIFEDLLERIKEKEKREAKKHQRMLDDFSDLLHSLKEINASSTWDDCKALVEDTEEYSAISDENLAKEIFEDYVIHIQEKAKEKDRKREEEKVKKDKDKEEKEKRKEKEKDREKEKRKERSKKDDIDSETMDAVDDVDHKEDSKREKDKDRDRKHRKRHHDTADESSDREDREESKRSRRHGSDRKKSRKHDHSPDTDGESRHRRHSKDHRDSRRSGGNEELEDGELGEDGEIQ